MSTTTSGIHASYMTLCRAMIVCLNCINTGMIHTCCGCEEFQGPFQSACTLPWPCGVLENKANVIRGTLQTTQEHHEHTNLTECLRLYTKLNWPKSKPSNFYKCLKTAALQVAVWLQSWRHGFQHITPSLFANISPTKLCIRIPCCMKACMCIMIRHPHFIPLEKQTITSEHSPESVNIFKHCPFSTVPLGVTTLYLM